MYPSCIASNSAESPFFCVEFCCYIQRKHECLLIYSYVLFQGCFQKMNNCKLQILVCMFNVTFKWNLNYVAI